MGSKELFLAAVLPAIVCGIVLLAACHPWQGRKPLLGAEAGSALGFGLAFALSAGLLLGWPSFPPKESWQWLAYLSLPAAIPGIAAHYSRKLAVVLAVAVAGLAGWLVVPDWQPKFGLWALALAATMILMSLGLDQLARRWRGATFPLTLFLTCVSAGAVLMVSGSAKLAMLSLIMAACCAAITLLSAFRAGLSLAGGASFVVAVLLPGLLWNGYFQNYDVPTASFFLLSVAPLGAWMGLIGPTAAAHRWRVNAVGAAGVLIPIVVAGILAWSSARAYLYNAT